MQSLDYKLKTSNTSYVTARRDVQYFPSSLSSFPQPLGSAASVLHRPPSRSRSPSASATRWPQPRPTPPASSSAISSSPTASAATNYYGRTVAVLKGREYNRNKAMEGFDEVDDPRIARTVHQGGYADVLLRPTMVGILRCGKMLLPQLNLVIEIKFADATTALWSENAGAHPLRSRTSEFWPPRSSWTLRWLSPSTACSSQEGSLVFSYPTVHTQQSSVPNGVATSPWRAPSLGS